MINEQVELVRPFPRLLTFFWAITFALLAVAIGTSDPNWAVGALLPGLLGLALFLTRERYFVARFTESSIEMEHPRNSIPYETINGIWVPERKLISDTEHNAPFPIHLSHQEGELWIPAELNVPSNQVYNFIFERIPPTGPGVVNALVAEYLDRQAAIFGDDRVVSFRQVFFKGHHRGRRARFALTSALILSGLVWLIYGTAIEPQNAWVGAGGAALAWGLIFFVILFAVRSGARLKKSEGGPASLVVSPLGIALVQGELRGELTWAELKDLKTTKQRGSFRYETDGAVGPGIELRLEGATVRIVDVYDRPLSFIHAWMCEYWR